MSYSVNVTGHADDEEAESRVLDAFQEAVKTATEAGTVYSASATSMFHGGTVDLRENRTGAGNELATPTDQAMPE